MISSGRVESNAKLFVKFLGDLGDEDGATIGYNSLGGTVKLPDVVQHQSSQVFGVGGLRTGDKVSHLSQSIHHRKDGVKAI